MTLENNTKQPSKADASLYNGRPTDTGLSCPSAVLTSCTPSISENIRSGVSVENVPAENKKWFVLRVSYGRIIKAKNLVEAKGLESYVPFRYKETNIYGRKRTVKEPLLSSFIFVHDTAEKIETLLRNNKVFTKQGSALLSYYYDHTHYCLDNSKRNPPLTISEEAMNNFIKLTSIKNPHIIPVTSDNIQFKLGDNVVVKEGEFKGVRGRVARIAGQQRVIVEVFDGCLVASAYIPKEAMKICNME